MKLEKGAPVRVRLHIGEAAEAVYECFGSPDFKHHYLRYMGDMLITVNRRIIKEWECRFVGPPCVLVPVGVSV